MAIKKLRLRVDASFFALISIVFYAFYFFIPASPLFLPSFLYALIRILIIVSFSVAMVLDLKNAVLYFSELLLMVLLCLLYWFGKKDVLSLNGYVLNWIYIFLPIGYVTFFRTHEFHYSEIRIVYFVTLITVIVTVSTSIIYLLENPASARYLATSSNVGNELIRVHNVGDFSFFYCCVFLAIAFLWLAMQITNRKVFRFIIVIVILIGVAYSQFSTALFLLLIGIVLLVFAQSGKKRALLFIPLIFIVSSFKTIMEWVSEFLTSIGLNDIALKISYYLIYSSSRRTEGDLTARISLYSTSFLQFAKNPLFGNMFEPEQIRGDHSEILDFLATTGIIGASIFFLYIFIAYKLMSRVARTREEASLIKVLTIIYVLLALVNPCLYSSPIQFGYLFFPVIVIFLHRQFEYRINCNSNGNFFVMR